MASNRNAGSTTAFTQGHPHRSHSDNEITAQLRLGRYTRDQRASTIHLAPATLQPGGAQASLAAFGPGTAINRSTPLKMQDLDSVCAQGHHSSKFIPQGPLTSSGCIVKVAEWSQRSGVQHQPNALHSCCPSL
jgi:catecholate siderophore receptor